MLKTFVKFLNPAAQDYDVGDTVLATYTPSGQGIAPVRWKLPAKVGDVSPVIRITFDDASTKEFDNDLNAIRAEMADVETWATGHGRYATQVEFIGRNAGVLQNVNLGEFGFEGFDS